MEVPQRGFRGHSDGDSQGKVVTFRRGFSGLGVGVGQSGGITALCCDPGVASAPEVCEAAHPYAELSP